MKLTLPKLITQTGEILKKTCLYDDRYSKQTIDRMLIGEEYCFGGGESFVFKSPVWGGECSLYIKPKNMSVELTWSSTTRSIPMALAAINNYRKALDIAAEIQGLFDSTELITEEDKENC